MQVVRIEMALANATLANFTKSANPHLWHAAQVWLMYMLHQEAVSHNCSYEAAGTMRGMLLSGTWQ